ncbi:hypothetical protein V1522DRAFT_339973, partial [Lipomyces starkeyi]
LLTLEDIPLRNNMSHSDCETSFVSVIDDWSEGFFERPQRSHRIDYRLLNDGGDNEAEPEDRISKKSRLIIPIDSSEPITPDDSASQLTQDGDTPAESPQEHALSVDELLDTSRLSDLSSNPAKSQNLSLWSHFDISSVPGKLWYPKRGKKGPIEDREIRCKMCNWKTMDSARATSTSNMNLHLKKHDMLQGNGDGLGGHRESMRQQSVATMFRNRAEVNKTTTLARNLIRWIVKDDMAFMAIESPAFQQIFMDLPGVSLPFTSRKSVVRRIDKEFAL